MKPFDIFKKKSPSLDELSTAYADLQQQGKAAAEDLKQTRIRALSGGASQSDIDNAKEAMAQTQAAKTAVKEKIRTVLETESKAAHDAAAQKLKTLEADQATAAQKAGLALGTAISLLSQFKKGGLGRIHSGLNGLIEGLENASYADAGPQQSFQAGLDSGLRSLTDARDFAAEKKGLAAIENRVPGSAAAENRIRHKISDLLNPGKHPLHPARQIKPVFD